MIPHPSSGHKPKKINNPKQINNLSHLAPHRMPRSHAAVEQLGFAVATGDGRFVCGECGALTRPLFHVDGEHVFVIGQACAHPWDLWSRIEAVLDGEAQP